ncbi:hypothetical protein [Dactylosporangium sp. NPDC000521]|uniref:hypothetical protein n=1 Tax=Dactylosporangium sp. NPDC000521 TaxID=3363975 RepID=UPI00368CD17B
MTDHVTTALHDALAGEAARMTTPEDPWPRFAARESAHRRVRRRRTATAVAAVLAILIGVQTNVVPLPGWVPAVAVAAAPSRLTAGPTRGSLAGDAAWLEGLRRQIPYITEPEGLWEVADRGAIRIVFAGDIAGHRLAFVLLRVRLGLVSAWTIARYGGPAGAAPDRMMFDGTMDAREPVATLFDGTVTGGGFALVVGPPGAAVTINGGAVYTAEGTVVRRTLATSTDGSGVASVVLPPGRQPEVATRVTVDGALYYSGPLTGGWSGRPGESEDPTPEMLDAAARGARGPGLDPRVFLTFTATALHSSRLYPQDVTLRLLWTGTVNGQPAGLLTLQPPGGGVVVWAFHGNDRVHSFDLRLLVPADGAFERPYAWRLRAEGHGDTVTDRVVVVAPPGAASVTVTSGGGAPVQVPLDASGSGETTVPPGTPAVVTAYTAGGEVMATTPLHVLEGDASQLPGDTPGTRVTGS